MVHLIPTDKLPSATETAVLLQHLCVQISAASLSSAGERGWGSVPYSEVAQTSKFIARWGLWSRTEVVGLASDILDPDFIWDYHDQHPDETGP